jgi:hypothetical protein
MEEARGTHPAEEYAPFGGFGAKNAMANKVNAEFCNPKKSMKWSEPPIFFSYSLSYANTILNAMPNPDFTV